MPNPVVGKVFLALANVCMEHGHWPSYFKVSSLVIIPKPGKPSYQSPRAFQPIVLLNTLGKLMEKMISTCLQFDGVKFELFLPHQFRGIRQRSTEDAGLFLTHLVHTRWAKGLKTSVVAFDVAQFFPSINHEMLLVVMARQRFLDHVWNFFSSYLVGRETSYCWNSFSLPMMRADVGVGQGSALSPVLSALYFSAVMRVFVQRASHLACDLLSYVDDGTIICQSKTLDRNILRLSEAYGIMFNTLRDFGLSMEHSKTELFHFSRKQGGHSPSISFPVGPYMGEAVLRPKVVWHYLGFFFDWTLSFKEHVQFYSTKVFTAVRAMGMLGNSVCSLSLRNKWLLYRSCVVPIATYGCKLWLNSYAHVKGHINLLQKMQ
jgi:hypothetical protein